MITRFYVDNYKCLVDFTYEPKPMELIIGANGSGKSTAFEALSRLRDFIVFGASAIDCFPASSINRWQGNEVRNFRINIATSDDEEREELIYSLSLVHDLDKGKLWIAQEAVHYFDDDISTPLFQFIAMQVQIFLENGGTITYPADASRSALFSVPEREDNRRLIEVKKAVKSFLLTHINPMQMKFASEKEVSEAAPDMKNFPSWYRHHSQENPEAAAKLFNSLSEIFDDFAALQLTSTGSDRRELMFKTKGGKNAPIYRFDELSDGQRTLIVLYALLHFVVGEGGIVCIDEPENFIALRELQPWLFEMQDKVEESGGQVLLISHNPEFINQMAPQNAVQFSRPDNLQTVVGPFKTEGFDGLTPAEVVARGWNQ